MAGLGAKLSSLVGAVEDPYPVYYVCGQLGVGLPMDGPSVGFRPRVESLRSQIIREWLKHQTPWERMAREQKEILREQKLATDLFQVSTIRLVARRFSTVKPEELRRHVASKDPWVRFLAIQTVSARRLHLEADLIERLTDVDPVVREAAREALIRVAHGTNFGPYPGASKRGMTRSIDKWRNWLALQQQNSTDKGTAVAAKPGKADPIQPVQFLLADGNREVQTQRSEVTRLRDELINATDNEQRSILARWREAAGNDHTDALAVAIPKLLPAVRAEAEDVLTQRLSNLPTATLRDKLQDDNVEVRRAAAFACGRKLAKELIPDLVQLLEDPETHVIQAARAVLTELSGEDFGPVREANSTGRAEAVAAWRQWCKEHTNRK